MATERSSSSEMLPEAAGSLRWIVLALACLALCGQYYAYDIPSAINDQMRASFMGKGMSEEQYTYYFNLLYTLYALPNIITPMVLGVSMEWIGIRLMLIILAGLLFIGQLLQCIGAYYLSMNLMLLGRVIYGLGGESMNVAQTTLLASWFRGHEIAFALGLNLSIARFGSVLNDILSPWIELRYGVTGAFVGGLIGVASTVILTLALCHFAKYTDDADREEEANESIMESATEEISLQTRFLGIINDRGAMKFYNYRESRRGGRRGFVHNSTGSRAWFKYLFLNREARVNPCLLSFPDLPFFSSLRSSLSLPAEFWLVCISCVLAYAVILPFNNIAAAFFVEIWYPSMDRDAAHIRVGKIMGILFGVSALGSPIAGICIDKLGYRIYFLLSSFTLAALAHIMLPLIDPVASMTVLGLSYTIFASAVWPLVAATVPQRKTAAAYGVTTAAQNLGLAVTPIIVAHIRSSSGSYLAVERFFFFVGTLCVGVGLLLWLRDARSGGLLNRPVRTASCENTGVPKRSGARGSQEELTEADRLLLVQNVAATS